MSDHSVSYETDRHGCTQAVERFSTKGRTSRTIYHGIPDLAPIEYHPVAVVNGRLLDVELEVTDQDYAPPAPDGGRGGRVRFEE